MRRGRRTRIDARRNTSGRKRVQPASTATRLRRQLEAPRATSSRSLGLDGGVVASTAILASLGVVMIYSTTAPLAIGSALPPHLVRHLLALCLGLLLASAALRIPLSVWRRFAMPLWAGNVLLLVATLLIGVEANGARRWLAVPLFDLSFQAAELVKWSTLIAVASVLAGADRASLGWASLRRCVALAALPAALLVMQPDLGNAVLLVGMVGVLLFVAGTPLRLLAGLGGAAALGCATFVALRPYALARWKGFLAPWQTARSEGFQLVQSFVAFGRGGALGVGLGDGRQKLSYLPEAHTDFILSVIAEELGLLGVLVVLGAFAALALAGMRIARRAREPFALLVAVGMTSLIVVPAAVNAAVVMGLLPTTGFTLPFLSFGSNSLVVCSLAVGILLRVASREASPRRSGATGARARRLVRA
jgi:cell division protein FtsW